MEKEGLQRVLKFTEEQNITLNTLVTDRHKQINKWLRETYPSISHYFDIWHVAKGMTVIIYNTRVSIMFCCVLYLRFP